MLSPLCVYGQPFDCTVGPYWTEPSVSVKRNWMEKEMLDSAKLFSKLPANEICSMFSVMIKTVGQTKHFFNTTVVGVIDEAGYCTDQFAERWGAERERICKVHKKNGKKQFERYMTFNNGVYQYEFIDYIKNDNPRVRETWFFKNLMAFKNKQILRILGDEHDMALVAPMNELIEKMLPKEQWLLADKYSNLFKSFSQSNHHNLDKMLVLICIFNCFNNKVDLKEAMIALWALSFMFMEDLFGLVLYNFQSIVRENANAFPYLSVAALEVAFAYLALKDERFGVTKHDLMVVYAPFQDRVLEYFDEDEPLDSFLDSFYEFSHFVDKFRFNMADVYQREILSELSELEGYFKKAGIEISLPRPNGLGDEKAMSQLKKRFSKVFEKGFVISQVCKRNKESIGKEIESIDSRAVSLGAKPLENIAELSELAEKKSALEETLSSRLAKFKTDFDEFIQECTDLFSQHNQGFEVKADPHLEEIEVLKALLSDANHEIEELTQQRKNLIEQAHKQANAQAVESVPSNECLMDIINILEAKNQICVVVEEILKRRPWVKVSDKLIKSLDLVANFSRPGELARQLERLTCKEFIAKFNDKGSIGAFEFFTKSALSFKESKTTMSCDELRRQREFMFAGEKMLCEAHLKIGINNTEQDQLRIHFLIRDSEILIGYIGRHLGTGCIS